MSVIDDLLDRLDLRCGDFPSRWAAEAEQTIRTTLSAAIDRADKLRDLALQHIARPLSVAEAQLLGVCRVCRVPRDQPRPEPSAFVLNYGAEFAHENCLVAKPWHLTPEVAAKLGRALVEFAQANPPHALQCLDTSAGVCVLPRGHVGEHRGQ